MDDFSAKAGVPNLYGLTGSEANSIAPGKRMLSSMTPAVEKNGKLFMVVGTWRIYHYYLCFANHIERIRI
jgi:gamma-glutamyltranspeptidase/glutathione hydrolase